MTRVMHRLDRVLRIKYCAKWIKAVAGAVAESGKLAPIVHHGPAGSGETWSSAAVVSIGGFLTSYTSS